MINRYVFAAIFAICVVLVSYVVNFYFIHGYSVSSETSAWAELGGFFGGILGPILSFVSLALLIKSLGLQNEANLCIREDLKNSKKTEKIRSFESLFFNMIGFQKDFFGSLEIEFFINGESCFKRGLDAVIEIESEMERLKDDGYDSEVLKAFIDWVDSKDQLYDITRSFYIAVKMINDKLSDLEGFDFNDRKNHLLTLINFTEFSQIRLIMINLQFMDLNPMTYLKNSSEFNAVLDEVGMRYDLY